MTTTYKFIILFSCLLGYYIQMKYIFLTFIAISSYAYATPDCKVHKLYCGILELKPSANRSWAMRFSNLLYKYARKYDMDARRSLAIAMQESSLRTDNHNHSKVIRFIKPCPDCKEEYEIVRGITDLSIFQFHVNTIEAYGIDPIRLKTDLEYAVDWHFKILKSKIKSCAHLPDAWACYNSATPHIHKRYVKQVNRWYIGEGGLGKT